MALRTDFLRVSRPGCRLVSACCLAVLCCLATAWCGRWCAAHGPRPPAQPTVVGSRVLLVPIEGDLRAEQAVEVLLYVSVDGGAHWVWQQSASPSAKRFVIRLPADGDFWFTVRTRDAAGKLHPGEPLRPQQAVRVDTQMPQLHLAAHRTSATRVAVHWEAADATLQPETLSLQWRAESDQASWRTIVCDLPMPPSGAATSWQGRTEFDAPASTALQVVARVRDQAGHEAQRTVRVASSVIALPPRDGERGSQSSEVLVPLSAAPPDANPVPAACSPAPEHGAGPYRGTIDDWRPAVPPAEGAPWAMAEGARATAFRTTSGGAVSGDEGRRAMAAPGAPELPNEPQPPAMPEPQRRQPLAPIAGDLQGTPSVAAPAEKAWVVASRRFTLAHRLPHGAGSSLELWATRDEGASWRRLALQHNDNRPMIAQVDDDGVYGLRLCVQAAGTAPLPPLPGEVPHAWVLVDATPPTCRIESVRQRSVGPEPIVEIRYAASDLRLAQRPIALRFRTAPHEPWITLAAGLENTGQFVWHVAETLGPGRRASHVELQLEVRDAAGHTARAQTDAPLPLVWPEPSGLVREIRAIPTGPPAAAERR
jgi:hypothetical protein